MPRRRGLARPARAAEEVGVRYPAFANSVAQRLCDVLLAPDLRKPLRPVTPIKGLVRPGVSGCSVLLGVLLGHRPSLGGGRLSTSRCPGDRCSEGCTAPGPSSTARSLVLGPGHCRGRQRPGEKPLCRGRLLPRASPARRKAASRGRLLPRASPARRKAASRGRLLPRASPARRKAAFSVSFSYPVAIALRLMLRIATSTLRRNEKGPLRPRNNVSAW